MGVSGVCNVVEEAGSTHVGFPEWKTQNRKWLIHSLADDVTHDMVRLMIACCVCALWPIELARTMTSTSV